MRKKANEYLPQQRSFHYAWLAVAYVKQSAHFRVQFIFLSDIKLVFLNIKESLKIINFPN